MQENGVVDKCPVCRKGTPWCNDLPVVVVDEAAVSATEEATGIQPHYGKKVALLAARLIMALIALCICWLVGYIFAIANDGEIRGGSPVWMSIIAYTATGFIILIMVGIGCSICALCAITCLSLGISEENIR